MRSQIYKGMKKIILTITTVVVCLSCAAQEKARVFPNGVKITAPTITTMPLTSHLMVLDTTGFATKISAPDLLTSAIQTQLNTRLPLAGGDMSGAIDMNGSFITKMSSWDISDNGTDVVWDLVRPDTRLGFNYAPIPGRYYFLLDHSSGGWGVQNANGYNAFNIANTVGRTYTFPNASGTIALTSDIAAGGGVSDGNKGEITVSGGGTGWSINNAAVTGVKIQDGTITGLKIQDNAITTTKILDGAILNADISASAAIAGTKIAINTLGTDYVGATLQTLVNETDTKIASINTQISEALSYSGDVTGSGTLGGTNITLSLVDNTILAEKLKATNAPTDKYVASFDNATGGVTWTVPPIINHPSTSNPFTSIYAGTRAAITAAALPSTVLAIPTDAPNTDHIMIACSDLTTNITTGTSKAYFRMPFAATLTGVKVSLISAGTVTGLTLDINEAGVSVLSTKLTTDATEATSATAAVAAVISDSSLANDSIITIDFDAVPTAGKGVIVTLYLEY